MKAIRKIASLLLAGAITSAWLAGCGSGGSSGPGTSIVTETGKSSLEQRHPSDKGLITCGLCGKPFITPTLEFLAGSLTEMGSANGPGTVARFANANGIAADSAGNVYVADTDNFTIRKIASTTTVTTLAGKAGTTGAVNGTGPTASFDIPLGIATDSTGNIYVADNVNKTIRKITPAGVVSTFAGTPGVYGNTNGTGPAASFSEPMSVATDSAGNVYVADFYNSTIRKITPVGVVTTLAGTGETGSANGTGTAASFYYPTGVAADMTGNVYVADNGNRVVRKITPAGVVSTLAGTGAQGSQDGAGSTASFDVPYGVAVDSTGNVYVADRGNSTIRKISPAGVVITLAGTAGSVGHADGTGSAASFFYPGALAIDSADNVYVADTFNSTIRMITPAGVVSTLAGTADVPGSTDGTATAAHFDSPYGVATDGTGNVYVADSGNRTIRKIIPAGTVSTLAGTAGPPGSANGIGAAARFFYPSSVATDSADNVYVADSGNGIIRKITPTGSVSTLAGTALVFGNVNGTGPAASFRTPNGVAADSAGNVYVADSVNQTIRKITSAGVVSTFAGTQGVIGSVDGTGTAARFNYPNDVATDSAGNVYVADAENFTIRKITSAGVVTTLAGTAGLAGSANGTGAAARFNYPNHLATDSTGNIYVADTENCAIRMITPAGAVSTLVGVPGQCGFVAGALPGGLLAPYGVAFNGTSLFITDGDGIAMVSNLP